MNEGSSLIGSSEDRKALKEEQDEVYRVSLLTDEKGCADLERKLHDEKRKERLQRARMERVLPEPSSDFVTVKIRHPSLGLQSRKFPTHTLMNSVYDWAGSLATEPEHFTLNDPLGRMLLPISELDDRCTLTMIESQEGPLLCCLLMMKLISWGLVQQLTQVNLVDGLQSLMNQTFKEVEMHNIQCLYHDFLFSYIVSF